MSEEGRDEGKTSPAKDSRSNLSYPWSVKTAVSMPDELFERAEAAARRLRVSRSELYAKAIAEFLKKQDGHAITDRLNDAYAGHPAKLDSSLQHSQLISLTKDDW